MMRRLDKLDRVIKENSMGAQTRFYAVKLACSSDMNKVDIASIFWITEKSLNNWLERFEQEDIVGLLREEEAVSTDQNTLELKVAEVDNGRDVGRGIVRIDYDSMDILSASTGDIIEIKGKMKTVAKCLPLLPSDEGKGIIRMDMQGRNNAGIITEDVISVRKIKAVAAEKVVVAPFEEIPLSERYMVDALENVPLIKGDNVIVPYFGGRLTFQVMETVPAADAVIVTRKTAFQGMEEAPAADAVIVTKKTAVHMTEKDESPVDSRPRMMRSLDNLDRAIRENSMGFQTRFYAVKLACSSDMNKVDIASIFGITEKSLNNWLERFEKEDIVGLLREEEADSTDQNALELKVVEVYDGRDVGEGIIRIDYDAMDALGASTGDVVEIKGKKRTVAECLLLQEADEGKGIIRIDGLGRNNSGITIGDTVSVRKIKAVAAEKVVVAPLEVMPPIDERYLVVELEDIPLIKGDNVMIPYFGGRLTFQVMETEPAADAVIVTKKTTFYITEKGESPA